MKKELLCMDHIVKTFPGVRALNNAAITVHVGEIMGFMGENGAGRIIETMEESGICINEIIASGGIAEKNTLLLQIYSDITGKRIKVADCSQSCVLGAAIYASLAAGKELGGYDSYDDAVKAMSHIKKIEYRPIMENQKVYEQLYHIYKELSDCMGTSGSPMEKLFQIKNHTGAFGSLLRQECSFQS
jgi:L-ribulokinase